LWANEVPIFTGYCGHMYVNLQVNKCSLWSEKEYCENKEEWW
jgi:hypothetical protein